MFRSSTSNKLFNFSDNGINALNKADLFEKNHEPWKRRFLLILISKTYVSRFLTYLKLLKVSHSKVVRSGASWGNNKKQALIFPTDQFSVL